MAPRPDPKTILGDICPNVYIEPPSNVQMVYPAILCVPEDYQVTYGDNQAIFIETKYLVTVIDADIESHIPKRILALGRASFGRRYVADNLHHFTFNVFF